MIYKCFTMRDGIPVPGIKIRAIESQPGLDRQRKVMAVPLSNNRDVPYRHVHGIEASPGEAEMMLAGVGPELMHLNIFSSRQVPNDAISPAYALVLFVRRPGIPFQVGDRIGWTVSHDHKWIPYRRAFPGELAGQSADRSLMLVQSYEPFVVYGPQKQPVRCVYSGAKLEFNSREGEECSFFGDKPPVTQDEVEEFIDEHCITRAPGLTIFRNADKLQVLCP